MSIILTAFTAFVVTNAPAWLASLSGTVLEKSQEFAINKGDELAVGKGKRLVRHLFHLDEKEQLRHLQQALKNAAERGLATFQTLEEHDLYKDILQTLSQSGESGRELRHEVMQFFTLAENPDFATLNDSYNRRQRLDDANHKDVDVAPYLDGFFSALIGELYADPYFRPQLSDVLQLRASASMQQSLLDIVDVLKNIDARLDNGYSTEDFARDVAVYTDHIESVQRNLKIIGIVPKDRIADPEISGIFVPLRIAFNNQRTASNQSPDAIVAALEEAPCLVLLGGPGSGKSTATKYLAWSHAAANQSHSLLTQTPLLSGNPLPLRIELRRLNEERKRANYDFLSFATEVLLKREGITINPRMFKELLTRRCLFLLFDGLDEVATLNERLELVNEIEHFAVSYPGNHILVTSRPVGYDLSRISHPLFAHAEVQNFDDQQIQQFLFNWYTAVLRLSPIPQREQEELDLLLSTLKENPRLHKLAESPLLLTVITLLHRYERLPDRRVLVYDRCADLLLETWAKLRGTDKRWQDMKMVKEDQYACVAYLGFVLHERSQEQQSASSTETGAIAVDVSSRFLHHCVEEFLKTRELIVGVAEQRLEAKRFIALVQEEAGLIVERGTGENSEPLYGFVHRTFQEYFAAADVYERYQQEEDSTIVSEFLREHLHDPHWREVISLLLGKLKSKPVTKQLKEILEGKIQSLRSCYTDIVQQDLFFVCDCLVEEIKVEKSLIDMVVSRLCDVVRNGCFTSLRKVALEYLVKLMDTRQCSGRGKNELFGFAMNNHILDGVTGVYAIQLLHLSVLGERQLLAPALKKLVERPDLSVEQVQKMAESLYDRSLEGSDAQQLARTILMKLIERTDLSVGQARRTVCSLYRRSPVGLDPQQLAITILTKFVERPDLSVEQIWKTAWFLYCRCPEGLDARQLATTILTKLVKRSDLSVEQVWKTAWPLYLWSSDRSDAKQLAWTILKKLMEGPDLSVEQVREIAWSLCINSREGSDAQQVAAMILMGLVERPDLSVEQVQETAEFLYFRGPPGSDTWQLARTILKKLVERSDLSVEQVRGAALFLYRWSLGDDRQLARMILIKLVERADLPVAQVRETVMYLYLRDLTDANGQLAKAILTRLVKRSDLSVEQMRKTAQSLYRWSPGGADARQLAWTILKKLMEGTDLSVEQVWETALFLYRRSPNGSDAWQLAGTILMRLIEGSDLSVEQVRETALSLYSWGLEGSDAWQLATTILTKLVERTDLSVEQKWKTAELLYGISPEGSDERLFATSVMLTLLSHADKSEIKDDVYDKLRSMVPQFHKLPLVEARSQSQQ